MTMKEFTDRIKAQAGGAVTLTQIRAKITEFNIDADVATDADVDRVVAALNETGAIAVVGGGAIASVETAAVVSVGGQAIASVGQGLTEQDLISAEAAGLEDASRAGALTAAYYRGVAAGMSQAQEGPEAIQARSFLFEFNAIRNRISAARSASPA